MEECTWVEDDGEWSTDCKHDFVLNEGTPEENDMIFCCFCGKRLAQFPEEEQEC